MNRLTSLCATVLCAQTLAWTPPAAPPPGEYIVDEAGILTPSQKATLNAKIGESALPGKTKVAIWIANTIEGNFRESVRATYDAWRLGDNTHDDGLLIVSAVKPRTSGMHTGKSAELLLPDDEAVEIMTDTMNPAIRLGDTFGALRDTLDVVESRMFARRPLHIPIVSLRVQPPIDHVALLGLFATFYLCIALTYGIAHKFSR